MGKQIYTPANIYAKYRQYMREIYGPGPWTKERYPYLDPGDRFLLWRARNFPEQFPSYEGWREVYLEEVSLSKKGILKKGRSEKRSRRSRGEVVRKVYPLPGTLA